MSLAKRWREYARQYGPGGLLKHVIARVIRPAWEQTTLVMLVLRPPASLLAARVPIRVERMSQEQAVSSGFDGPDWRERWGRGEACFGAWVGDRCVHYSWVSRSDTTIGEAHGVLRMGAHGAYIYDCFTAAECRGNGIFAAVLSAIGAELFGAGIAALLIAVEADNRSSLRGIEKAGFRPAGQIQYRRAGPWSRTVATGNIVVDYKDASFSLRD